MQTANTPLEKFNAFRNEHGNDNFKTRELACEFSNLKCAWWGSNLVPLGVEENEDGTFSAKFNVFD